MLDGHLEERCDRPIGAGVDDIKDRGTERKEEGKNYKHILVMVLALTKLWIGALREGGTRQCEEEGRGNILTILVM
jgi:hypothetical protein